MKKNLKKLASCGLALILSFTITTGVFAYTASDITTSFGMYHTYSSFRHFGIGTYVPSNVNWVRVTSSAVKYPSGSALLDSQSYTGYNSSGVSNVREIYYSTYTGNMTVYGAHSFNQNGNTYIKYTSYANVG